MKAVYFFLFSFFCLIHSQVSPSSFVSVAGEFPEEPNYTGKSILWHSFQLPYTSAKQFNPVLAVHSNVSASYEGFPDFGSDLYRVGDGTYYAVSNGGPFVACSQNPSSFYAPLPLFSPTAIRFSLSIKSSSLDVDEKSYYWLRTQETTPGFSTATGLSPLNTNYNTSACTTPIARYLGFNRSAAVGLDPGAIAVLKKKQSYLIGEGYYPSLVLTDSSGLIRARYVPTNAPNSTETNVCLTPILPPILSFIRRTRDIGGSGGFSGIALTNEDTVAWAILRRPLGSDATDSPTKNAQIHRVIRLDVSGACDHSGPVVTGMFLYQTTPLCDWQKEDPVSTIADIKVTALAHLTGDKFLVLERGTSNSLVYEVDFSEASNVLNDPEANYLQNLILETRSNYNQTLSYIFPKKTLILDLKKTNVPSTIAAEGLAIVTDSVIALLEDNSWNGTPTKVHTVLLGKRLPLPEHDRTHHIAEPFSGPRNLLDETLNAVNQYEHKVYSAKEHGHRKKETVSVPNHVKIDFNLGGLVGGRK